MKPTTDELIDVLKIYSATKEQKQFDEYVKHRLRGRLDVLEWIIEEEILFPTDAHEIKIQIKHIKEKLNE